MRRALFLIIVTSMLLLCASAQEPQPAYRNSNLPVADRVSDLLGRMTLEEKVAQITGGNPEQFIDSTGEFTPEQAQQMFRKILNPDSTISPHDAAVLRNAAQRYRMEKIPPKIPALFMGEALHGNMAYGSTSFPIPLGLASIFDPNLVRQVFTVASDEMSATGVRQAFTPVLDLGRDPRWGRTEETYGEDPYLVSRMGVEAIEGLQGTSEMIDSHHVLATMKHFAAHGQPQGGVNTAPANYGVRTLRETFFVPFEKAVEEAHVGSVMASYNEIDGVPSHINRWLLDTILRKEWGFNGYVTSDGGGLEMLYLVHHVAAGPEDAASKALAAGVDFDLSNGSVYRTLIEQVKNGKVPESEVDRAAGRVLAAKFRLGLFDHPYVDPAYAEKTTNSPEHRKLALRAAEESIVLLKNENHLLPLNANKLKTVAVIGPLAADLHLGGYARDPFPGDGVTILQGIRARLAPRVQVMYAEGCKITLGKQGVAGWYENNTQLADPAAQTDSIREAAALAKTADAAILVVGETESTDREAWSDQHRGDRDSLDLLGAQEDLIRAVVETGTPTVVFLINGRPLSIRYAKEHVPAILEGWFPGDEGGTAAAEVLFGDANPGGKLPITFPKSVGQIPIYYNHRPSSLRNYIFSDRKPLFPFGYGLSYTTFRFENLRIEPKEIKPGQTAKVSVDITNTGDREGDEVAQMYVHQRVSSVTRAVIELKGFERVHLKPGEKTTVQFEVTPEALSLWNLEMKRVVEPGIFDIEVGPDSENLTSVPLTVAEP
jgi:beta-glucosidase